MKIYLAHNFAAREVLPEVVKRLENLGHKCTSTWIFDDTHDLHAHAGSPIASACVDIEDIDQSHCLVLFADQYGKTPGRGKYVEFGYAIGMNKRVIVVGEADDCVFYHLPGVERAKNFDELLEVLCRMS